MKWGALLIALAIPSVALAQMGLPAGIAQLFPHTTASPTSCPVKMTGYTHFTGYTLFRC